MTWKTHYLRAATEQELKAALPLWMVDSDTDAVIAASQEHALDWFGEIPNSTNFHANLRLRTDNILPASLQLYLITPEPQYPKRVFIN